MEFGAESDLPPRGHSRSPGTLELKSTTALRDARQRLTHWLVDSALPLWADQGVDRKGGGFFEQIDQQGRPIEEPRRTRVVARQIYVFAAAERWQWMPGAASVVDHGLEFLLTRLRRPDGSYASGVLADGTVVRPEFDLYEQAFALFAMATAYAVDKRRSKLPSLASDLLDLLCRRYAHPIGGFEESAPPSCPLRANPHMHMLEAALAWSEVQGAPAVWLELADELAQLCLARLIDADTGAVREYFDAEWRPLGDARGRVVEPGHQFEWGWLMARWGTLRQRPDALEAAKRLIEVGEEAGVDGERNLALNELNDGFEPVDRDAKVWPQTERLKAWCVMAELARGDARAHAIDRIDAATDGLMRYFRVSPAGLWGETIDAKGRLSAGPARASSLYHIVFAIETLCATERRLVLGS